MSIKFCENELCRLNSVEIAGPEFDVVTYREANGKEVKSKRHIIVVLGTTTKFALCDICAYVAAMVSECSKGPLAGDTLSSGGVIPPDDATPGVPLNTQPEKTE
jgi:hypothetical protein